MRRRIFLLAPSLLLLLAVLLLTPGSASWASKPGEYANPTYKIAFPVPAGYRLTPSNKPIVVTYSKAEPGAKFAPRFNLQCYATPKDQPKDSIPPDVEDEILEELDKDSTRGTLATARFQVRGADALSVAFVDNSHENLPVRGRNVFIVRKGYLYVFTFAAPEDKFKAESAVFEKMLEKIRWLP